MGVSCITEFPGTASPVANENFESAPMPTSEVAEEGLRLRISRYHPLLLRPDECERFGLDLSCASRDGPAPFSRLVRWDPPLTALRTCLRPGRSLSRESCGIRTAPYEVEPSAGDDRTSGVRDMRARRRWAMEGGLTSGSRSRSRSESQFPLLSLLSQFSHSESEECGLEEDGQWQRFTSTWCGSAGSLSPLGLGQDSFRVCSGISAVVMEWELSFFVSFYSYSINDEIDDSFRIRSCSSSKRVMELSGPTWSYDARNSAPLDECGCILVHYIYPSRYIHVCWISISFLYLFPLKQLRHLLIFICRCRGFDLGLGLGQT